MRNGWWLGLAAVLLLGLCGTVPAATYYVDFAGGSDANDGASAETAFKHAPGDSQAADKARAADLAPGDTVLLKGGVVYYGMLTLNRSGAADKPITIDGNSSGTFGKGRAIVNGATPLTGWKRAASPEEAQGHPRWKEIFYVDIPKPGDKPDDLFALNLCEGDKPLPIAQQPKPADPFLQEHPPDFYQLPSTKISTEDKLFALQDEKVLTQTDPHYYDHAWVGLNVGNNFVHFQPVRRFDPATHRLFVDLCKETLYKTTPYSIYNAVRLIDHPGEFSVEPTADDKTWRIYLWPRKLEKDQPAGLCYSTREYGLVLNGQAHVLVKGLLVRRQGRSSRAAGFNVTHCSNVTISDCEITLVNGLAGLEGVGDQQLVVEKCFIHQCPGHTKGLILTNCTHSCTRSCRIVRNTGTGADYYTCQHCEFRGNVLLDHHGMHSNGMTFTAKNKDLVIAGNEVRDCGFGLTVGDGEDLVICYNLLEGNGKGPCVGIWEGPLKNAQFLNNLFLRANPRDTLGAALALSHAEFTGLVFRNNIIDGLPPGLTGAFEHNIYTRWGGGQKDHKLGSGETVVQDLRRLFVDPDHGDFHTRSGSPAIRAGLDVGQKEDLAGTKLPAGQPPDIGAYQFKP